MTVEDLALLMAQNIYRLKQLSDWETKFLLSVENYILADKGLSTTQSEIVLKTARRHATLLARFGQLDPAQLAAYLKEPTHRHQPYPSTVMPREVRYLGDNRLGFRFKLNAMVRAALQGLGRGRLVNPEPYQDPETKVWIVCVGASNIDAVSGVIRDYGFIFDEAVLTFLTRARNAIADEARPSFALDPEIGIAGLVPNNEFVGWWLQTVMDGEIL